MIKYTKIDVELQFRETVYGGVPKNSEVGKTWAELKGLTDDQKKLIEESTDEVVEKMTTGWLTDDVGVFALDITMKAHLKDCLSRLGVYKKKIGSKNEMQFGGFIRPERLRFTNGSNTPIKEPHGKKDCIAHVNGPQGRRSALKTVEYLDKPNLKFSFYLLNPHSRLTVGDIENAFLVGQEYGYGANRSMGIGRYDIAKFDKIDDVEIKAGDKI